MTAVPFSVATVIRSEAQDCRDGFKKVFSRLETLEVNKKYIDIYTDPKIAGASGIPLSTLLQNEYGRFNVWAANTGVFAKSRISLDYRLRDVFDVREILVDLLRSLTEGFEQLRLDSKELGQLLEENMEHKKDSAELFESIRKSLHLTTATISRLNRLSNAIFKAGSSNRDARASNYVWKDNEGNDLGSNWRDNFAFQLCERRFPKSSVSIKDRVANAMLQRRKRLLYRQERREKLALRTDPGPTQKLNEKFNTQTEVHTQEDIGGNHERVELDRLSAGQDAAIFPSTSRTTITSNTAATPLDHGKMQSLLAHSRVSSMRSMPLDQQTKSRFPAPPRLATQNGGPAEAVCPYCGLVLFARDVNSISRWQRHVLHDLDPYVCLVESCTDGDHLYGSLAEWFNHTREEHRLRWTCNSRSHPRSSRPNFENREHFVNHMREEHQRTFVESDLDLLAKSIARPAGPAFDICPLCKSDGTDDVDIGTGRSPSALDQHIGRHMILLALQSIPWAEDDSGGESSERSTSKPETRSTIHEEFQGQFDGFEPFPDSSQQPPLDESSDYVATGPSLATKRDEEWGRVLIESCLPQDREDPILASLLKQQHDPAHVMRRLPTELKAEDIVILVTGLTGSGKTSFINLLADRQSGVGTGLHSNSSIIQVVSCTLDDNDKNKVYLVDMQALDDEGPSDVEVLREVASWLKNSNLKLTGMLYLHPISAPRLHGKTTNNLRIFRKIYGDNALSNVIIVTTMWDIIQDVEVGDARETELISRDEFFRPWIASGSQVSRHNNTKVSASDIVHNLLGKQQTTLEIQYEMLHLGKQLKETKAGLELADVWERNRQNYLRELLRYESELEVARAKQEHELITDLEVAFITIEKKIQRLDSKVELLEVDAYQLHKERDDKESTEQRRIGQSDTAVDTPTEKVDEIAAGMHHSNEDGVKEKLKAEPSANVAESHRERPTENPVTKQDPIREIGRDDQMILVAGDTANSRWEFIKLAKRDGEELHTYSLPPYKEGRVTVHSMRYENRVVHLVEMPSDDKFGIMSLEHVQESALWLTFLYERGMYPTGVILLQNIEVTPLDSPSHNLEAYKKMCGNNAYKGVVIATTGWESLTPVQIEMAGQKQRKIQNDGSDLIGEGGLVMAIGGLVMGNSAPATDALAILRRLVTKNYRLTLAFQRQLVDENKCIYETDFGAFCFEPSMSWAQRSSDGWNSDLIQTELQGHQLIVTDLRREYRAVLAERLRVINKQIRSVNDEVASLSSTSKDRARPGPEGYTNTRKDLEREKDRIRATMTQFQEPAWRELATKDCLGLV